MEDRYLNFYGVRYNLIQFTAEGRALFDGLREHVVGATVKLLGNFDLGDIETTVRTMKAVTALAEVQEAVLVISKTESI